MSTHLFRIGWINIYILIADCYRWHRVRFSRLTGLDCNDIIPEEFSEGGQGKNVDENKEQYYGDGWANERTQHHIDL